MQTNIVTPPSVEEITTYVKEHPNEDIWISVYTTSADGYASYTRLNNKSDEMVCMYYNCSSEDIRHYSSINDDTYKIHSIVTSKKNLTPDISRDAFVAGYLFQTVCDLYSAMGFEYECTSDELKSAKMLSEIHVDVDTLKNIISGRKEFKALLPHNQVEYAWPLLFDFCANEMQSLSLRDNVSIRQICADLDMSVRSNLSQSTLEDANHSPYGDDIVTRIKGNVIKITESIVTPILVSM